MNAVLRAVIRNAGRALDTAIMAFTLLAVAILVALVASVSFEVVMRYFLNRPTRWVVEFSEYALLYLAFLAGAWVLREEGHVKVDMLVEILPPRIRAIVLLVTSLLGMATCAAFFWVSTAFLIELYDSGEVLFRSVQVKKWAVMAVMAPGLLLLALQFLRRAWHTLPAAFPGAGFACART